MRAPRVWCDRCGERTVQYVENELSKRTLEIVCVACFAIEESDLYALREAYARARRLRVQQQKNGREVVTHPDLIGWPPQ